MVNISNEDNINEQIIKTTSEAIKNNEKHIFDMSEDINMMGTICPDLGYKTKIELIKNAEDMSTTEKIKAIDASDNKYQKDMHDAEKICVSHAGKKANIFFYVIAGTGTLVALAFAPKYSGKAIQTFKQITRKIA